MFPKNVFQSANYRRIVIMSALIRRQRTRAKRRGRPYISQYLENRSHSGEFTLHQDLQMDSQCHHRYFRMSKGSYDEIFFTIEPAIYHPTNHAFPIPTKLRLNLTLRFLATGQSQAALALQYRISPPSVNTIIRETMTAIITRMEPKYLPSPTKKGWLESEQIFRNRWKFPFCCGAVDGKHVRVKAPWKSGSLNYNYKGFFSVVILAVVSGDYRFLVADIGAPGSESDAAIFSNTSLARMAERNKLGLPENGTVGEHELPYVFVGDEAFPLKPWLMRPFPGNDLDLNKRIFNYRLSRARRVVENAFGIWVSRFRILHNPIDGDADLVNMIIRSTIVLHNFLRTKDETGTVDLDSDNLDVLRSGQYDMLRNIGRVGSNNYNKSSFHTREEFVKYFVSSSGEIPYQADYVMRS